MVLRLRSGFALTLMAICSVVCGVGIAALFRNDHVLGIIMFSMLYSVAITLSVGAFVALKAIDKIRPMLMMLSQMRLPE